MGLVKAIKPTSLLRTFHQNHLYLKTLLTHFLTRTFRRLLVLQILTAKTTCTRRMFTSRTSTNRESLEARIDAEESTVALNVGSSTEIVSCNSINGQLKFGEINLRLINNILLGCIDSLVVCTVLTTIPSRIV